MTETNHHPSENVSGTEAQNVRSEPIPPTVEVIDVDVASTQTDWFTLAQSLRQQNQNLHRTIVQLEQALADAQQNLQIQTRRVRSAETLIDRQTEELNQTPEKVDRLVSELESSQQTIQQQQSVINHLGAQLEKTQGQLAYLERECSLLQEDRTGKTHQLLTAEKHMRELQARLNRQQRYTLQYKSALEQISESETRPSAKVIPLVPKKASIHPWTNVTTTDIQESVGAWVELSPLEESHAEKAATSDDFTVLKSELEDVSDEFLEETEEIQSTAQLKENSTHPKNWSFSIEPASSAWKKTPSRSVDLPTFLREQSL